MKLKSAAALLCAGMTAFCAGGLEAQAGTPKANIIDARADRMFRMIEADIRHQTGFSDVEITQLDLFTLEEETAPDTTTYCGLVRYQGAPDVAFVIRTPPFPIQHLILDLDHPADFAAWRGAGCERDGSIFLTRPADQMFPVR